MKKISNRRGSALLIAVVIVLLTAGIGGAFLALAARSHKDTFLKNQTEDAQQICDAGLEMARAALLNWRNQDPDPTPPTYAVTPLTYPANVYSWNKLFAYCALYDVTTPGMGASADPDVIRKDAMKKFKDVSGASWAYAGDQGVYNYEKANAPASLGTISYSNPAQTSLSAFEPAIKELFCINRRYGKGAFHLSFKNNSGDTHGDGIDHQVPPSGNPWGLDGKVETTTYDTVLKQWVKKTLWLGDLAMGAANGAGAADPMIDGDGQAILVVTATLPDGTCHQVEALLSYPFKGNQKGGAINDNGDISMQGAFNILGTQGSVWANGNVTGNGSAQANISGAVNAAGSASGLSMANKPGGGINSNADPIPISPVNISDYLNDSKYKSYQDSMIVLHKDGTSTLVNGTPVVSGMTLKNGTWQMAGKTAPPPNKVFYVEGDFKMTGQGNNPPYQMTVIATGSIELGGNSAFIAATDSTGISLGSLAIAGADIKLSGTGYSGGVQFTGNMFANEQIAIKGTFDLEGSITGANAADSPGSIVSSSSQLSDPDLTIGGNPTIVFNGGGPISKPDADHLDVKTLHRTRSIAAGIVKFEK